MSETVPVEATLDLATPRCIVLKDRGQTYSLNCRRITETDWLAFFANIFVSSEYQGKELVQVRDTTTALPILAEAVLDGAAGYKVAGGADLMSLTGWQRKIPMAHRILLGATLASVSVSAEAAEIALEPEAEVVSLDATWTAGPDYEMQRLQGLKHTLKIPNEDQFRRYTREASRSVITGGSRSGRTIYPGANALLAKLYDELVISVDGYTVNRQPLTSREQIIREMDTHHKVTAAEQIFQPQSFAQLTGGDAK